MAGMWVVCGACGAVIADEEMHIAWHGMPANDEGDTDGSERTEAHGPGGE